MRGVVSRELIDNSGETPALTHKAGSARRTFALEKSPRALSHLEESRFPPRDTEESVLFCGLPFLISFLKAVTIGRRKVHFVDCF
jgi:hypothetical protein